MKNKPKAFIYNLGLLTVSFILAFLNTRLYWKSVLFKYEKLILLIMGIFVAVGIILFAIKCKKNDRGIVIRMLKADAWKFMKLLLISIPIEVVVFSSGYILTGTEIFDFSWLEFLETITLAMLMLFAFKKKYIVFRYTSFSRNILSAFFTVAFLFVSYIVNINIFMIAILI